MREVKRYSKPNKGVFQKGHIGMPSEKNPNWKGDSVGYTALHNWLYLHLGQPSLCEMCGRSDQKKYEWANLSGEYKREVNDWKRLCVSCHRKFDGHGHKAWQTRREQGIACGKPVKQLDKNNHIVAMYSSISEASRVTSIHDGNISSVISGKRKYAGGYRWELAETMVNNG